MMDFEWLTFICMQCGLSLEETRHAPYWFVNRLLTQWQKCHNLNAKQMIFTFGKS